MTPMRDTVQMNKEYENKSDQTTACLRNFLSDRRG